MNHALIDRIINYDSDEALKEIYAKYRKEFLIWAIAYHSCGKEEAKEVFQQTIVAFYENIINGNVTEIKTKVKTYLFSIGKNIIYEIARKKGRHMLYVNNEFYSKPNMYYQELDDEYENKLKLVRICLTKLGDPCKSILEQYYFHKKSMQKIAEIFNYKGSNTVKSHKYKCLHRLKQIMKSSGFDAL